MVGVNIHYISMNLEGKVGDELSGRGGTNSETVRAEVMRPAAVTG